MYRMIIKEVGLLHAHKGQAQYAGIALGIIAGFVMSA